MLGHLWRNRELPPSFSKRWITVWARRARTLPELVGLLRRRRALVRRGATVGPMTIVENCHVEGPCQSLQLGDGVFLGRECELVLHDRIRIGEHTVINRRVTILTGSHSLRDELWRMNSKPVVIGARAWIATGAMILPGVTIGDGAVIGAGAVVREDVPAGAVAVGNPATITPAVRARKLSYDTANFPASLQAWIGLRPRVSSTTRWDAG